MLHLYLTFFLIFNLHFYLSSHIIILYFTITFSFYSISIDESLMTEPETLEDEGEPPPPVSTDVM